MNAFALNWFEENLMYSVEDITHDFKHLINLNEDTDIILNSICWDMMNNKLKISLNLFEFKWFETLECINKNTEEFIESVEDLYLIHNFFEKCKKIIINTRNDLEELIVALRLSDILLDSARKNNNLDCLWKSFYQLESKFKLSGLL